MTKFIYTDSCCGSQEIQIMNKLNLAVIKRLNPNDWNINDVMLTITNPMLSVAVFNTIDTLTIMEIALLSFMCKPIIYTSNIDLCPKELMPLLTICETCSLLNDDENFIDYYIKNIK